MSAPLVHDNETCICTEENARQVQRNSFPLRHISRYFYVVNASGLQRRYVSPYCGVVSLIMRSCELVWALYRRFERLRGDIQIFMF